jgi:hypothetical protein
MKLIKLFILAFVISIVSSLLSLSYSQTIYFCEGVDDDGEPINESSNFTIPEDGGYLYVLVQLPYEIDCGEVGFEIYRNGKYDTTISMDTEYNWAWFYKQITFYKSGEYKIEVYDYCNNEYVASGSVEIDKD